MLNLILASSNSSSNWRGSHKIRNLSFKFVIFKEKKAPKLLNYFNSQYQKIYDKVLVTIADNINEYENLSYEDKCLVDFVFALFIG
jgi:hypothetical protein